MDRRQFLRATAATLPAWFVSASAAGEGKAVSQRRVLLTNSRLFDGNTPRLKDGLSVFVEGSRIVAVAKEIAVPDGTERIDCGGRALIPGLIDSHVHLLLAAATPQMSLSADAAFLHLLAGREARRMLHRGFTTVRDMAGPTFALKTAIDRGIIEGPRIFPSGAALSQTSGHGDFRMRYELPRTAMSDLHRVEVEGISVIADGVPEVLRRTREQLMKGAAQIKIMAGGGVSSLYDPLHTLQYTAEEMRAAVQAASDWGTYVAAHAYTPEAIQRCVKAGVRSIEHGQLADEETVRMMADAGVWWSIQPFLDDADTNPKPDPVSRAKQRAVSAGTERAFELSQKHKVRLSFGTDIMLNPQGLANQGRHLAKFASFMAPLDALRTATGAAGEMLAMSGECAPYAGALGVIQPGAMADLLVIDGDPARDLNWLLDTENTLRLIMKDGHIHQRSL